MKNTRPLFLPQRRRLAAAGLSTLGLGMVPVTVRSQDATAQRYPNKAIRLVVPFAAGQTADILARLIAQKLSDRLGQAIFTDNRIGAGGLIGTDFAAKSAPDGYTLFFGGSNTLAVNPNLYRKVPFDAVKDFAPITLTARFSLIVVVHPSLKANSIQELIALARARPGEINYASTGVGTTSHLATELFKTMAKVDMTHVPYKGNDIFADLLEGRVSVSFAAMPPILPHIKTGRLRALAVTGASRSPVAPDLPTVAEAGVPGYVADGWFGFFAPAGTPPEIITRLNREIIEVLKLADVQAGLAARGFEGVSDSPEHLANYLKEEIAKWGKIVRDSGAQAD